MSYRKKLFLYLLVILLLIFHFEAALLAETNHSELKNINDVELVEYHLKIVRIDESDVYRFGLNELILDLAVQDLVSFITAESFMEMAGIAGSTLINFDAYQSHRRTESISSPVLTTLLEYPVSLRMTEEILEFDDSLAGGMFRGQQTLELDILPVRIDNNERILTDLSFNTGSTSAVETRIWSEKDAAKLIGIINWERQTSLAIPLSRGQKNAATNFAVYLTHDLVTIDKVRQGSIISLDGLNEILWPDFEEVMPLPGYFQILADPDIGPDIEMLILDQQKNTAFELRTDGKFHTIEVGLDAIIREDLRLGIRSFRGREGGDNELELAVVLNERVFLGSFFEVSGAYYPIFFKIENGQFTVEHAFWLETALKFQPLSARLRYSSLLGRSDIRLLLGFDVLENTTIIAGVAGNIDKAEKYKAGLRVNF